MCFGTRYLFIIHELAFLCGFICGQSLQLCKPGVHLQSLVTWNSLLKMGKIVSSHFHTWCLHCRGALKKGAGGEDLVSACSHTYIWICTESSWLRHWGRVCQAFQAQIWTAWCAACFIQRPHIRWFSNKRKNIFSTVEPFSALILIAGYMLMESSVFSMFSCFWPSRWPSKCPDPHSAVCGQYCSQITHHHGTIPERL